MGLTATEAAALARWHAEHGRDFPWRHSRDGYRLTVTELMLVRTRADQVAAVWRTFFGRFPDLASLAEATFGDVEVALHSLGLRWRAERIWRFAREAHARGPVVPVGEAASGLSGVGPYVQAAVEIAVRGTGRLPVDVTIARVITRLVGINGGSEPRRHPAVRAWVDDFSPTTRDAFHAFLDLAAEVCVPHQPACSSCPLRTGCAEAASRITAAATASSSE